MIKAGKIRGLLFILVLTFLIQCFPSAAIAQETGACVISGVVSRFDYASGEVKISGKLENSASGQNITVLAVPGGTDMENFEFSDVIYIRQINPEGNIFNAEFSFFKKPEGTVDIYIGGTNIENPAKTNVVPEFKYILVDSLSIDVSTVTATAYVKNYSDADKSAAVIIAQYDKDGKILGVNKEEKSVAANTSEPVRCTVSLKEPDENAANIRAFVWNGTGEMIPLILPVEKNIINDLKVLAIGNSFSEDSVEYLYQIAESSGIRDIKIGNLYVGSCSLATHWSNALNNKSSYTYYKNTTGSFVKSTSSIYDALKDEDWDIIVMQQVSGLSGQASSYEPYLSNLKAYVNEHKTNPKAVLAWHMTWAYQGNSTHADFSKYNNSQMAMYNAITDTVQDVISSDKDFTYIIPSGTAVQNMRTSYIGDNLTRDGFHLSVPMGRYVAGLTWFRALTGLSTDDIDYVPDGVSSYEVNVIKEAVNNAFKKPFEITTSSYREREVDLNSYKLLDYTPMLSSYWYSTNNLSMMTGLSQYAATKRFTKEELPVGSIIVIEDGWQYRPEGWINLDTLAASRPSNVSTRIVDVTESWWGNYNYRAFNISKLNGESLSDIETIKQNFKIYIKK